MINAVLKRAFISIFLVTAVTAAVSAQELPAKIRGYKVEKANIRVAASTAKNSSESDAVIKVYDPEVDSLGLSGIGLSIGGEITSAGQSGTVEMLSFRDFRINGIRVEVEEYTHPFNFRAGEKVLLPFPVKIFVSNTGIARAALKELLDSKKLWVVTGKVLVFGRFKKYGFSFKRVVPVDLSIEVENPARSLADSLK